MTQYGTIWLLWQFWSIPKAVTLSEYVCITKVTRYRKDVIPPWLSHEAADNAKIEPKPALMASLPNSAIFTLNIWPKRRQKCQTLA